MKKKRLLILLVFITSLGLVTNLFAQKKTTIETILQKPVEWVNEFVSVDGFITQYTPATASTTANYLVQGNYGGIMKVNTSGQQPKILAKYRVTGTIIMDPVTGLPYVIEKSRITPPPPPRLWLFIGLAGFVLLVIIAVVVLLLVLNKRKKKSAPVGGGFRREADYNNEFKTVKIVTQPGPKTLTYIPGKLEIMNGNDAGKQFKLAAMPGAGGAAVVTIGSREETGDKKFTHIQLMEKTVSRSQAELIYIDKRLYVKNLSTTNLTQLNGVELQTGEQAEVFPGSKIRTGEVVFQYIN